MQHGATHGTESHECSGGCARFYSDFVNMGLKTTEISPPPMGSVVSEFLKICSKPRNLMIERVTLGWNLH